MAEMLWHIAGKPVVLCTQFIYINPLGILTRRIRCILCQIAPFPGAPVSDDTYEMRRHLLAHRNHEIPASDSRTPSGDEPRSENFVGALQVRARLVHTVYVCTTQRAYTGHAACFTS